jgi:AraC-like DNA-binding protein
MPSVFAEDRSRQSNHSVLSEFPSRLPSRQHPQGAIIMLSQSRPGSVAGRPYVPVDVGLLAPTLIKLLDDASNAVNSDTGAARSCLEQALARLRMVHMSSDSQSISLPRRGGLAPWQEHRVTDHIEAHLDGPIRLTELADISRLSLSYFSVAFRQSFGSSLQTFITHRRVERAQTLMLSTDQTLADIALACGFCDQAHFCRRFRRVNGRTPNAWRRQHLVQPAAR